MTVYHTYRKDVPLKPGETVGYRAGRGYYARPAPPAQPPYGVAGPYKGRGIMLGGNPDVWDQALTLSRRGHVEVVAVIPSTPQDWRDKLAEHSRVVDWYPPEVGGARRGELEQAENQGEWDRALTHEPAGIACNWWGYGRFPKLCVALVECYYNEGQAVDFGIFKNYTAQGAMGVVPLCGGYSAPGRSNEEAAAIYHHLATWSGGPFPGFWMYAGESLITPESVAVLVNWKPSG